MFSLLRRQYDGIGELLRAMKKSYTISAKSVQDAISLLASLGQIRSLLSVRMGTEEEKLMIDGLGYENICIYSVRKFFLCAVTFPRYWNVPKFNMVNCFSSDIMNNKIFYQHPNLMRVLGMHETVMEVMVNVLGGDKSQVGAIQHGATVC